MKKIIFSILASCALMLWLPNIASASPLVYQTERIAGQDRVETALDISQKGWDSASKVILCESSDYPDSIASTPYAVSINAPILLTKGDSIDQRVVQELERLNPQEVILLGGSGCLKPAIEKKLDNLSIKWERIGGKDRYETSVLLAKHLSSDSLILTNGDNFPDALSAATYAGIKQIPIVLTSTTFPNSIVEYYKETQPKHLIVIGGEGVVPPSQLSKNNFTVETRLGGSDRYETNAKVVSYTGDSYTSNDLFLASGLTFPDAVAGTVLASKEKAPLLLTQQDDIPPSVYSLLREHMKVEPPAASSGAGNASDSLNGIVTASAGLNLRNTPSTTGKVLSTIPKGTLINLIDLQDQWYKTTYQSNTGWVSAAYVTPSSSTNFDPSPNGTVFILGGTGIISSNSQNIIEGKTSSKNADNLAAFPPLPSEVKNSNPSSADDNSGSTGTNTNTNTGTVTNTGTSTSTNTGTDTNANTGSTVPAAYDPSTEVLVDPFQGLPSNALAGKTIMVDPGHGGPDTGAIGPNKTCEKDNNLAIALDLNDILQQAGAKVILTRDQDISPASNYTENNDLQARVDLANKDNPDLFICIHNDSFGNPDVQGTSTYYSEDNPKQAESVKLAKSIESSMISTVKTNDRGVKEAPFYVLRYTNMPAILLEAAFISSPYEEARLQNPTFRQNVATAIFHGIYDYYNTP